MPNPPKGEGYLIPFLDAELKRLRDEDPTHPELVPLQRGRDHIWRTIGIMEAQAHERRVIANAKRRKQQAESR